MTSEHAKVSDKQSKIVVQTNSSPNSESWTRKVLEGALDEIREFCQKSIAASPGRVVYIGLEARAYTKEESA